ncbi:MAG: hypothetical protein RJA70_4789, partial [Pseudomonadota bacterium]
LEPAARLRRKYPYLGKADGLTTALRREFAPAAYLGLELEVNQASLGTAQAQERLGAILGTSLASVCA